MARGFSGRYRKPCAVPDAGLEALGGRVPCQLYDAAWLLLSVNPERDPDDGVRWGTIVRLDQAAVLDLSARQPPPGAYTTEDEERYAAQ